MPDLEETLRRLSASFADEVISALRQLPLEELMALSGDGARVGAKAPAAARPQRTRGGTSPRRPTTRSEAERRELEGGLGGQSPPRRSKNGAVAVSSTPDPSTIDAAERVFVERGSRGATAAQLMDALAAQGAVAPAAAADIIRVLVERELVRDAGFRRTTGQGTAPVFVTTK